MVDDFIRETGLIVCDQRDNIFPGDVLRGDHYEFVPCDSWPKADVLNPASRNLAANGGAVNHIRQRHVIHVLRLPGHFFAALFAWDRHPDNTITRHELIIASGSHGRRHRARILKSTRKDAYERSRRKIMTSSAERARKCLETSQP